MDAANKRRARVQLWLAKNRGLYAKPEVLDALGRCPTRPALEFAATVLTVPGWRYVDSGYFENHAYRLTLSTQCGGHLVQMLFSSRSSDKAIALDVVSESSEENEVRRDDQRAHDIRQFSGRYVRLTVGNMSRAMRWLIRSFEAEAGQRARFAELPQPLVGRATTGDMDWAALPPPVREMRLRAWLEVHRMVVKSDYLPVLAQCETTAEMRFLVPILQVLEWRIINDRRLATRSLELRVQWPIGDGKTHFDFLIGTKSKHLVAPFAVEIIRPSWQNGGSRSLLAAQQAAQEAGYRFEAVQSIDAARRGAWWCKLLQDAQHDSDTRVQRVSEDLQAELRDSETPP
jgi:hypothetical protein